MNHFHTRFGACIAVVACVLCAFLFVPRYASARVEWELLRQVNLNDTPYDIALSKDGSTAYILCSKSVLVYAIGANKITDTIPMTGQFSHIALSEDGETLFLTDNDAKRLSLIRVENIFDIDAGASPVIGKKDAPVSVVAFFDYQCPYCAKVYPTLDQLLAKYPEQVNLVIKHFPLRMHPHAEKASLAALAASRQDKYQAVTKAFFDNFRNLNETTIKQYAEESGVDMKAFQEALDDPSLKKVVSEDISLGARLKVRGVPTLFINGRRVKDRSLDGLSFMVETELKQDVPVNPSE